MPEKIPPWKKKRPPGPRHKLTEAEKARAKASAAKAGRRYPNLIDNMKVLKQRSRDLPSSRLSD